MPMLDELLQTLQPTKLHATATAFTGAPQPVTPEDLEKLWDELQARPQAREKIRAQADVPHPTNDLADGSRLPQVLLALAVLSKKEQVVLTVGAQRPWHIESLTRSCVCLEGTQCPDHPQMRTSPPDPDHQGKRYCCGKYGKDLAANTAWATDLDTFAKEQRTALGLTVPEARTYFFANPKSLELCALSRVP